jgi:hypothetical protein
MRTKWLWLAGLAVVATPAVAAADEGTKPFNYSWSDSKLASDVGISTMLGGGVTGFTDQTMRDTVTSNVGGLWDLRVTLGSHTPLAIDVGYIGTAANINALIGEQSGTLVGTTFEGAVRYNVMPHYLFTPYAFAGVGWQRYDVTGGAFSTSDSGMADSDNSVVYPMGVGFAYRHPTGLVADLRGTFRASSNAGLVLESAGSSNFAPLHTWEASGAIGYEF